MISLGISVLDGLVRGCASLTKTALKTINLGIADLSCLLCQGRRLSPYCGHHQRQWRQRCIKGQCHVRTGLPEPSNHYGLIQLPTFKGLPQHARLDTSSVSQENYLIKFSFDERGREYDTIFNHQLSAQNLAILVNSLPKALRSRPLLSVQLHNSPFRIIYKKNN